MGADYQEIAAPASVSPPTGHFALMTWIAGSVFGSTFPVIIVPPTGLGAVTLSTTPLGCGSSFTSPAFDFGNTVLGFLNAMAFSDQASAANGFSIQQSIDGINWDVDSSAVSVLANAGVAIKAAIAGRYARVSYVNGGVPQGVFRLGARATIA